LSTRTGLSAPSPRTERRSPNNLKYWQ
jgi:hypothetical protein